MNKMPDKNEELAFPEFVYKYQECKTVVASVTIVSVVLFVILQFVQSPDFINYQSAILDFCLQVSFIVMVLGVVLYFFIQKRVYYLLDKSGYIHPNIHAAVSNSLKISKTKSKDKNEEI